MQKMTCPISLVILAVMMFATQSQHASTQFSGTNYFGSTVPQPRPKMANENPLTSHILDTTRGRPASNVRTIVYKYDATANQWVHIIEVFTNKDGRVGNLIGPEQFTIGVYKIFFDTKPYFQAMGVETFYPFVEIVFEVVDPSEHHHVPLLLNPYGYSTYRGS